MFNQKIPFLGSTSSRYQLNIILDGETNSSLGEGLFVRNQEDRGSVGTKERPIEIDDNGDDQIAEKRRRGGGTVDDPLDVDLDDSQRRKLLCLGNAASTPIEIDCGDDA